MGHFNRLTAEARLIHTYADRNDIDNYSHGVQTYFEMRDYNRQARAMERGPRATQADLVRFAAQGKPAPLSPGELSNTGEIAWPLLLQADEFTPFRAAVEKAFIDRANKVRVTLGDHKKVRQTTDVMLEVLKLHVDAVPPMEYTSAVRFIESLAFEARKPLG